MVSGMGRKCTKVGERWVVGEFRVLGRRSFRIVRTDRFANRRVRTGQGSRVTSRPNSTPRSRRTPFILRAFSLLRPMAFRPYMSSFGIADELYKTIQH